MGRGVGHSLYRSTALSAAAVSLAATLFAQQAQPAQKTPIRGSARVVGRVVAADTGAILRNAKVTLTALEDRYASTWLATTDDEGRFDLRELPSATFNIRIIKAGFVEAAPPNVVLTDKSSIDLGDLRVVRGGVIVGRVVDNFGEPVAEASVGATKISYRTPASKGFQLVQSTKTNDLGEFRLYGLSPGSYYVSAGFGSMRVQARDAGGQPFASTYANAGSAPALTFYPGTVRAADAQAVQVNGGEQTFVNLPLISQPLATLTGHVVDSKGQPTSGAMVMLSALGQAGGLVFNASAVEVDARGSFVINNLQPGDYELEVIARAALEAMGRTGTVSNLRGDGAEAAFLTISIAGDQKDLLVQTSGGFNVRGRLMVDGGPVPADWMSKLNVVAGTGVATGSATVGVDGTFTIEGVDGHRRIQVIGLPAGTTVERVQLQGRDVLDEGLDVSADVHGIEIAITSKVTTLAGTVIDAKGASTAGDVIVFAENSELWDRPSARFVKTAHSSADQGFRLTALPPGRYLAVAVADLDEFEWANPVNLEKLRAGATLIVLGKGEKQSVTLVRK
jgi:protocatechuate 3,4-dioxygenase beta subunit